MLQAVTNAFKIADLRRKILFTLAMLLIFRLVAHVPVPGVNLSALQNAFNPNGQFGGLFNVLNIFSGGTLQNFSIAAMGVYPYITASIIIQLLTGVIPRLTELSKEGEAGRNQLNRYEAGTAVTPQMLLEGGVIRDPDRPLKILGDGNLDRALAISAHKVSESARQKIEAAGGSVDIIEVEAQPRRSKGRSEAPVRARQARQAAQDAKG